MYIQKEKGITLIALIVTIIIILILATVGGYSANKVYENAEKDAFIKRMQLIAVRVGEKGDLAGNKIYSANEIKDTIPKEIYNELDKEKDKIKMNCFNENGTAYYYFFIPEEEIGVTLSNTEEWSLYTPTSIKEYLGLDNIDDYILANRQTKEVISLTGITYNGKKYYTQYNLPGGAARPIEELSIRPSVKKYGIKYEIETTNNGLNCIVKINPKKNGQDYSNNMRFKYKRMTEWPNTRPIPNYYENYNADWIDMNRDTLQITQSGYYVFMGIERGGNPNYSILNVSTEWRIYSRSEDSEYPLEIILANPPKLYETTNEIELVNNIAGSNSDIETTNLENWRYNYAHLSDRSVWNPILSNNSAGIREENKIYFWMPRFAYKYDYDTGIINIVTLKGNSNISTWDDKELTIGNGSNDWKIPELFYNSDNPNEQYRGVWIEKKAKSNDRYIENGVANEDKLYKGTSDFSIAYGIIDNGITDNSLIEYNSRGIDQKYKIDIKPVI